MTSNLDEKGLRSIIDEYDLFFIDVWGVLHNGIKLFQNSAMISRVSSEIFAQTHRRTRASAERNAALTRAKAALTSKVFTRRTRGNRTKILVRRASNFFKILR